MGKSKLGPLIMGFCCCFKTHLWQTFDSISFLEAVFGCGEILGKKGRNIKLGPLIVGF